MTCVHRQSFRCVFYSPVPSDRKGHFHLFNPAAHRQRNNSEHFTYVFLFSQHQFFLRFTPGTAVTMCSYAEPLYTVIFVRS